MAQYKFEFDDDLTESDDQTDFEHLGGMTWDEFWDKLHDQLVGLAEGGDADARRTLESIESVKILPERGWCEFCHLRRATGMVTFLQGRRALPDLPDSEWIHAYPEAQMCRPCAREMGYTNEVSLLVPEQNLTALRSKGPVNKGSIGSTAIQ